LLIVIIEVFVNDGCASAFSIMLLLVKKSANCIGNDDSVVIINTNPINNTANVNL
jgi:hypothetical protein